MATYVYQSVIQQVSQTFINPYSGYALEIDGLYGIDPAPYHGTAGADILIMSVEDEILNIENSLGDQVFSSIETVFATNGRDIINLASSTYTLGDMSIYGGNGDDVIWSNNGNDILLGQDGNDVIDGGGGNDTIYGGSQNDIIYGGAGNDLIYGEADDDHLYGNSGNDLLDGGAGYDVAYYSLNYNQYNFTVNATTITIEALSGDEGTDTVSNTVEKIVFANGEYANGVFTSYNVKPVLGKDKATVNEDSSVTVNVLKNDTDANGDTLTVIAVSNVYNGTAVINADNTITYTPDHDYFGSESFLYTVSDGHGGFATQRVNVTINAVEDDPEPNIAPDLTKDSVTMDEDTSAIINVLANDHDSNGDTLTVISLADVLHGTAVINVDNTITYTPDANYVGTESFLYTVSDGNGGFATQRVNVTINNTVDTYSFDSNDFISPESISGFADGDVLDISDILSGYDALNDAITDFVQITDNGTDTIISVDADGGADNFVQIATLFGAVGLTDEAALELSGTLVTV